MLRKEHQRLFVGLHVEVELPQIADGYGVPNHAEATVGRTWNRGGRKVGYLNASCSGGRLQVKGKLKFELHGEKLQGRWTLVRMSGHEGERQEPWMLIKGNDEVARPASEYDIVEDLPDSVVARTKANTKNTKNTKATKKTKKTGELNSMSDQRQGSAQVCSLRRSVGSRSFAWATTGKIASAISLCPSALG